MLNFNYHVPTKILFGKNKIEGLGTEIKNISDNILIVYGSSSIKKTGLYETVTSILKKSSISFKELSEISPNPRIKIVRKGVELCKKHSLKFILAVGGGSVIDTSKAIAAGACCNHDAWDFFLRKAQIKEALPIGTILTLSATGSEMNGFTVISNEETKEKLSFGSDLLRPQFSILDPTYTYTLPANQTSAGIADIFSHILESYFCKEKDTFLCDRIAEALMKTCIEFGPILLKEPDNYNARAQIMWASSLALNSLIASGKTGDWATHYIEHAISAVYDITHGFGLAIITPSWMEYVLSVDTVYKFVSYAENVWGVTGKDNMDIAKKGIEKTKEFFKALDLPLKLSDVGIDDKKLDEMTDKAVMFGPLGAFKILEKEDIFKILKSSL